MIVGWGRCWRVDATLRRLGGVPASAVIDNEKTVTVAHVAGVAVGYPMIVAAGRHYGIQGAYVCSVRSGVQGRVGTAAVYARSSGGEQILQAGVAAGKRRLAGSAVA
jgi:hypothetical protein